MQRYTRHLPILGFLALGAILTASALVGFVAPDAPLAMPWQWLHVAGVAGLLGADAIPGVDVKAFNELSQAVKDALASIKTKADEVGQAIKKSDDELVKFGKVTDETKNLIADVSKKFGDHETAFNDLQQEVVKMRGKVGGGGDGVKSVGQQFVESDAAKSFGSRFADGKKTKGQSDSLELKNITSVGASAGPAIWSYRDPEIVGIPNRPRSIRSLIPTVPVNSNLIEWVQVLAKTNNARMVSEGGLKPKSELTYQRKETAVRKIAHYFKTSMEVLQDFPRLRAEIDNEGVEMLLRVEEDELLEGDGTGLHLLGLIPQATDYNVAATSTGDTAVDVLRRAILQVRQSFYSATGIVMNPADWAAIELLKDTQDRYLFSSATSGAPARLWGLPVVESDALDVGEFLVGAFATAATIYDRMQNAIYMSTENEDDFIRNMVTILFEERLALAVKRPLAFIHGNLDGAA